MTRTLLVLVCCPALLSATGLTAQNRWARADSATVRLPAAAFPALPPAVARALSQRHCTVPQLFEDTVPRNVVAGHFRDLQTLDWAVLCSVDGISRILVFWAGDSTKPSALSPSADRAYLQAYGGSTIGFSHYIGVASPQAIRDYARESRGVL